MKLPQRPRQHDLEEISRRYFHAHLPENWTTTIPFADYGVDQIVHIFDNGYASPYEIHVQLKSSESPTTGDHEKIVLRVATYNHLMQNLHVTMLIKYVAEVNEAYWIFLSDLPEPEQENDTYTININKNNKLSQIAWDIIEARIREIVDYKLSAGEYLRNRKAQGLQ